MSNNMRTYHKRCSNVSQNKSLSKLDEYMAMHGGFKVNVLNGVALLLEDRFLFVDKVFPYRFREVIFSTITSVSEVPDNMVLVKINGEDNVRLDTNKQMHDMLYSFIAERSLI